jgi:hypothetical protein
MDNSYADHTKDAGDCIVSRNAAPAIHFIERHGNVRLTDKAKNEWESGYWVMSKETATRLVGGFIYLHSDQAAPSHFGGKILSFYVYTSEKESKRNGRYVFIFQALPERKGVKTSREGWGNEKKIIW